MIIKLTAIKDTKLGSKDAKEIQGTKVFDGDKWSKKFFANQKDLTDQLHDFDIGDVINVVMEQKGDYWNIVKFEEVTDNDMAKKTGGKKTEGPKEQAVEPKGKSSGSRYSAPARADGGTRGDDTNRASAIYLAKDLVLVAVANQGGVGTLSPADLGNLCVSLAEEVIFPYIKDGVVKKEKKRKEVVKDKDPLAPPVED